MKTLLFIFALALASIPVLAFNERPTTAPAGYRPFVRTEATHASITVREDDFRVSVGVFKPQGSPARIRVTNVKGKKVLLERVPMAHRSIRLDVDLRHLPDGSYDLVVEDHQRKPVQQMRVELQTAPDAERRIVAIPFP